MPLAVHNPANNYVRTLIRDDHNGYVPPDGWELLPVEKLPDGWTWEPVPEEVRAAAIAACKQRARDEILSRYPEWKQANLTARAVELVEAKIRGNWTKAEAAEAAEIRKVWEWIKSRRAQSDIEEAALQ